ncbi:MAG: FKBP-type peptidyl-prolyl cis-trans isomerase [Deltaproteobacteria bacterium]|nr:MAG: FKBP-type peptidyl-prolyl cis-trans isomerase [Deltaproteobacteria bacterium]
MRIHSHSRVVTFLVASLCALPIAAAFAGEKEKPIVVEDGKQVSIEYTLTLADGSTADSNVGGEPLQYEQGSGRILPALEAQLAGLKVNESKHVELSADEGYGPVNPEAFQEVEAVQIPEEARSVGAVLLASSDSGQQRPVRVHEVREDKVVLDLNHPLAGESLIFDVKILAIE